MPSPCQDDYDEGFEEGRRSRDDEVNDLKAQLVSVEFNAYARGYENGMKSK